MKKIENHTVGQLKAIAKQRGIRGIAKERGIRGYYKLRKAELIHALEATRLVTYLMSRFRTIPLQFITNTFEAIKYHDES